MARVDWSRGRKRKQVENGFLDPLARRAARAERNWERTRRSAPAAPSADPDDDFLALLAVRADQFRPRTPAPPKSDGRVEIAKAALVGATVAVVHTDGGCEPNPGRGGWGTTIDVAGMETICLWGGVDDTTNNRMEMTAAVVALSVLPPGCAVTVITDSQYLQKGMTLWMAGWKSKGFRRGEGMVPNADLWRTLDALATGRTIKWRWVRGHNGHAGNERVDRLAARGIKEIGK